MTEIAGGALSLSVTRRLAGSPAKVFDAWLSPLWAKWLPPSDVSCELVVMEPHVGGRYQVRMTMSDGRALQINGEYLEVSRPDRLVMTWCRENDPQETVVTVVFQANGEGTTMTLRHDGFAEPELCARHSMGWSGVGGALDKLSNLMTIGK